MFKKQAGALKFNKEQMNLLWMMKEHTATSFHIEMDDLDYTPFDAHRGRNMMNEGALHNSPKDENCQVNNKKLINYRII